MTPNEIKQRAKQVNEMSLDYHLSHVVFACNSMMQEKFKEHTSRKIDELKGRLSKAEKENHIEEVRKLSIEIDRFKRPFRISVEYFNDENMNGGRVIILHDSNQIVIEIPKNLLEQSRDKKANDPYAYIVEKVKELRIMMAHEIGHIVLQLDEFLKISSLQGTKLLSSKNQEEDAKIFAQELIRLRHERNEYLYKSGAWSAF